MKNKTILVSLSLILLGSGLIFGIKYFLKFQSPAASTVNKTETSRVTVTSSTSSPEYLLDQMFAKGHWPHGKIDEDYTGNTVEGIIIRNENVKIVEKTITASSSPSRYNVTLTYPQFSGFSDVLNEEKLNKRIENEVKETLKQFQDEAKRSINSYLAKISSNNLFLKWDIYVSKKEMASMRLISWEGYETMRGINRSTISFSYDMVSGQELFLKDFFIPESDFIARIRKIASERNTLPDDSSFSIVFGKSSKETEDLLNCLITERGVVCGYDYSARAGEYFKGFSIEWKDLEDVLNPAVVNRIRE